MDQFHIRNALLNWFCRSWNRAKARRGAALWMSAYALLQQPEGQPHHTERLGGARHFQLRLCISRRLRNQFFAIGQHLNMLAFSPRQFKRRFGKDDLTARRC